MTARAHRPPGPRHARSRHARSRRGRRRRPSGGRRIAPAGVALTLGVALLVTVGSPSRAAFRSTANTGTNSITAGTVSFGANSPATAVLSASNVIPGTTGSGCVKLTYQGSLTATVKAYVAAGGLTGTGLGSYLTFQLNEGTGNNSDCSDFALASTDYNATGMSNTGSTIATFAGSSTGYATGVGAWSAATNATRTYQFVWQVADNNSAAGTNMSVTFTWEAQA